MEFESKEWRIRSAVAQVKGAGFFDLDATENLRLDAVEQLTLLTELEFSLGLEIDDEMLAPGAFYSIGTLVALLSPY